MTPLDIAKLEDDEYSSGEVSKINFVGLDDYIDYLEEQIEEYRRCKEEPTYYQRLLDNAKEMILKSTEEILGVDASYYSKLEEEISSLKARGLITILNED